VSDPDRSMHRSLYVLDTHSSFIEGSHMTKNTASEPETKWYGVQFPVSAGMVLVLINNLIIIYNNISN
jgi:hypothetical protein